MTVKPVAIVTGGAGFIGSHLVDALVTHRFPLEDAPEAFRVAGDKTTGALRVVLEPSS